MQIKAIALKNDTNKRICSKKIKNNYENKK